VCEIGKVHTLWYGFEDKTVKPVFFNMHGGGFILMSAEADVFLLRNSLLLNRLKPVIMNRNYETASVTGRSSCS